MLFIVVFLSSFFCYAHTIPSQVSEKKHAVFKPVRAFLQIFLLEEASGFFIDQNTFVTNFHVVAGWKDINPKFPFSIDITSAFQHIKYPNVTSIRFTGVQQLSILHDLALLKTSEPVPEEFVLKPGKTINKNIYIIGYPRNFLMLARQFSGRIIEQNDSEILVDVNSSRHSFAGASGSPLFNENGEIVGVLSQGVGDKMGLLSSIPIKYVLQLQELPDLPHIPLENLIKQEKKKLKTLAESGDPLAQVTLGHKLFTKGRSTNNDELALKWLKKAAMQNQPSAFMLIAVWFREKIEDLKRTSVAQEPMELELLQKELHRWLLKGAEHGDVWCQYHLAMLKAKGMYGVSKNLEESMDWLFKAAVQGHSESHRMLSRQANKKSNSPHLQSKIESYLKALNSEERNSCRHTFSG